MGLMDIWIGHFTLTRIDTTKRSPAWSMRSSDQLTPLLPITWRSTVIQSIHRFEWRPRLCRLGNYRNGTAI